VKVITLRVLCEGQTERNFVTQTLGPHLVPHRVYVKPELLGKSKSGGVVTHGNLRSSIKHEVGRSRAHEYVTTMIDLYALPADYPGKERCAGESGAERATRIEAGMAEALPNPRFIPYVQVHEFEALVLVDVDQIPSQFPDGEATGAPERLRHSIGQLCPEEVDDGCESAPSKRIVREIPAYACLKPIAGPAIAQKIGLPRLREACPHFDQWIGRLEQLAEP
jgi:hypothetical protein